MPLNYDSITIAESKHSSGRSFQDAYRCNYTITDQTGNTYVAFKQTGATLRTLSPGTRLKIGWKWNKNIYGKQEKVIQWLKVESSPKKVTYKTPIGNLATADIEKEFQALQRLMS